MMTSPVARPAGGRGWPAGACRSRPATPDALGDARATARPASPGTRQAVGRPAAAEPRPPPAPRTSCRCPTGSASSAPPYRSSAASARRKLRRLAGQQPGRAGSAWPRLAARLRASARATPAPVAGGPAARPGAQRIGDRARATQRRSAAPSATRRPSAGRSPDGKAEMSGRDVIERLLDRLAARARRGDGRQCGVGQDAGRQRQAAHDRGGEAMEAAGGGHGAEPGERRRIQRRVEPRSQALRLLGRSRGGHVAGVERDAGARRAGR